ncbi:MAG: hypothetical protein AB1306_06240 [Nitrospirota bacterium]
MDNQNPLIIRPQKETATPLLFILLLALPALTYYFYLKGFNRANWDDLVFLIIMWVVFIVIVIQRISYTICGENIYDELTVKLTPQGFYKGTTLYRWHDIDYFGVKRVYVTCFSIFIDRRVVYWNYKPSSIAHQFGSKALRFLSGYDDALTTKYEIDLDELAKLLNEWKTKYTGHRSEIETDVGLNRKLSTKEIAFGLAFALFLIFAIATIAALVIKK